VDVKVKGIIALVLTAFFWGTTFILVKETVSIVPLDGFLSIRFALAGLIILIPTLKNPNARKDLVNKSAWVYGSILGLLLYASYWFQTEGLSRTTPSKAAFITGISVILVPILGIYPFRLKVSKEEWFSVLLAITGLSLMTLNFSNLSEINDGDAMILVTAICLA
jgi:drug/metabolite transporter (DMT)-like permease